MTENFSHPLLSICIPTANRWHPLSDLLESLENQTCDKVEIVVCDNGADETFDNISRYNVRYFHNKSDIGYDRNVIKTIRKANGKYCWFLNDTSSLVPGAVDYLLAHLNYNHCVYLSRASYQAYTVYANGDEALRAIGPFGGKLNRVIIRRDLVPPLELIDINSTAGFVHLDIMMRIAIGGSVGVIKDLHAPSRYVSSWASKNGAQFTAHANLYRIFKRLVSVGYSRSAIEGVLFRLRLESPYVLVRSKANGLRISRSSFDSLITYGIFALFLFPLYLSPSFLFVFCAKVLKRGIYADPVPGLIRV